MTTLSGQFYSGHAFCTDALSVILESVVQLVEASETVCLTNPAHPDENICEKWDKSPEAYQDFVEAVAGFHARWLRLLQMRGLAEIETELESLFGEARRSGPSRNWQDNGSSSRAKCTP